MSNRALLTLLTPPAAVLLPAAALIALAPHVALQAASVYPFIAMAAALLLAARFRRSRAFAIALTLPCLALAVRGDQLAGEVAAFLFPVVIALIALTRDTRVPSRTGTLQTMGVLGTVMFAAAVTAFVPDVVRLIVRHEWMDPIYTDWSGLAQPALALWVPALVVIAARAFRSPHAAEAGLLWCSIAVLLAFASASEVTERVWILAAALTLIVSLVESSRAMAFHDDLTGLLARRSLNQALESLRPPYAIAIVDIDHFKTFNDRHGHDVGDQVLRMVAARLERVRGGGTAFRSGGEEFTVVFPGITRKQAAQHMEDVREAIAGARFTLRAADRPKDQKGVERRGRGNAREQKLGVTISVGLAEPTARTNSVEAVVKAADKAMYRAKKNGRNRVVA